MDFFFELPNKDKFTLIGIIVTAATGFFTLLISLRLNKRSSYVNSITNERLNSMMQLKQNTANYISMLRNFIFDESNIISIEKLFNLKLNIEFQLNYTKENENLIIHRMENILKLIDLQHNIKSNITVKALIDEVIGIGIERERIPIPYSEDMILSRDNIIEYLKRLIKVELDLLEIKLKEHIKSEWEKIKSEI